MTGQFEFVHSIRVPGLLHTRVRRQASANGRYPRAYGPSSVQHIPGVMKVVVQKDFAGAVARTQYAGYVSLVRRLAVQWDSGPELAPQNSFLEHLQNGFRMQCCVDSGDVERTLASAKNFVRARNTYPYRMHGSVRTSCASADVNPDEATI